MRAPRSAVDVNALVESLAAADPPKEAAISFGVRTWFSWRAPGAGAAAKRQLLHLAASKTSPRALQLLLDLGADPNAAGDDGATPMHCACHAGGDALSEVLELLLRAGANRELRDSLGRRPVDILLAQVSASYDSGGVGAANESLQQDCGSAAAAAAANAAGETRAATAAHAAHAAATPAKRRAMLAFANPPRQQQTNEPKQTRPGDVDRPEYRTDDFRMFRFKVELCANAAPHDLTACPFAHAGEKARRRDPRAFSYSGAACPDFRKGVCKRGDACQWAHGVFGAPRVCARDAFVCSKPFVLRPSLLAFSTQFSWNAC